MKKGEMTREQIIRKSATLFNLQGYSGVSLNDITDVTGIKKGGIYRHFINKDEIAKEALDYAAGIVFQQFLAHIHAKDTCYEKLLSIFDVYSDVVEAPPFTGGCPLMNSAVEHDDGHPILRQKAREIMNEMLTLIMGVLRDGIQHGELHEDTDAESIASFLISILEGGILLSKLEGDNRHIRNCKENAALFLQRILLR